MRITERNRLLEEARTAEMLTVKHAAVLLGVSERTIWQLVHDGKMPAPITVGRLRRWRAVTIREWIEAGCPAVQEAA